MKFVIIAPARSGSTLLREMLDEHPQVCCSGEVFGKLRARGLSKNTSGHLDPEAALNLRQRNPIRFLRNHVFASERPAIGFKLLYSQLFDFDFVPAMHWLLDQPDIRIIHLWRRDLVARHVSESRLRLKARARAGDPVPDGFLARLLKPAAAERSCAHQIAARYCAHKTFEGKPALEIAYEDFIGEHARESQRLCAFLGVDPGHWPALVAKPESIDTEVERLRSMPALACYSSHL